MMKDGDDMQGKERRNEYRFEGRIDMNEKVIDGER
jgi:hypothetical protein